MSDIDQLVPWQLKVYVNLLKQHLEKEQEERKKIRQQQQAGLR